MNSYRSIITLKSNIYLNKNNETSFKSQINQFKTKHQINALNSERPIESMKQSRWNTCKKNLLKSKVNQNHMYTDINTKNHCIIPHD